MVIRSSPEGDPMSQRPREIVSRMRIDSLEKSKRDPNVDSKDMEILPEHAIQERSRNRSLRQDQHLQGVRILRSESNWRAKGVVFLVNVLVKRSPVERSVGKVVERVLEDEEKGDLSEHEGKWGKGDFVCRHAEIAGDRVEEVDQGEFASKVCEEDVFGTCPDLFVGDVFVLLNLPFLEVRHGVDDEPWDAASKVNHLVTSAYKMYSWSRCTHLVNHEREQTSGDDWITHPNVIARPGAF